MKPNVTVNHMIDIRRSLKNGSYPVKIRVTYQRVSRAYGLAGAQFELTKAEYSAYKEGKAKGKLKDKAVEIDNMVAKAREIVKNIDDFSFDAFRKKWEGKPEAAQDLTLEYAFAWRIERLHKQGRAASAANSETASKSLIGFFGAKKNLTSISPNDLNNYLEYMRAMGKSMATVGIYTRDLRRLYNELRESEMIDGDFYPFGKAEFRTPKGKKSKTALRLDDIRKIVQYQPDETTKEGLCIDLWLFSYLCSGMNMKDIANLRYSDIKGNYLFFVRDKTRRRNRTEKVIKVPLVTEARNIISRRGNKDRMPGDLIFPILSKGMTPEQERKQVQNISNQINKRLKRIAVKLNLSKLDVNGISARDSFATISLQQGRPISDISDSLGHSDISVTQHYLAQLLDEEKMEWQTKLL